MIRVFGLFVVLAVLTSCSQVGLHFSMLKARHEYNQGRYQEANIELIRAQAHGQYEQWISYNLGTVYYALGESVAAEQEWVIAGEARSEALLYRSRFNLGVLEYELGRYGDAYESFRNALEVDPASVEAKINLEHALEKMLLEEPAGAAEGARGVVTESDLGEVKRILDYLSRTVDTVWKSTEQRSDQDRSRDW